MDNISKSLKNDKPNIALHGLYHEYRNCKDFHTLTTPETRNKIDKGLLIFEQVTLPKARVFIPPAWYVSLSTLEALNKLSLKLYSLWGSFI